MIEIKIASSYAGNGSPSSISNLESEINEYIKEGYKFHGQIIVTYPSNMIGAVYHQPMIKQPPKED